MHDENCFDLITIISVFANETIMHVTKIDFYQSIHGDGTSYDRVSRII